jgi:hypothetical protein
MEPPAHARSYATGCYEHHKTRAVILDHSTLSARKSFLPSVSLYSNLAFNLVFDILFAHAKTFA